MNAFRTRNAFFLILGKREKTNIQKVALNYYICEHFYSWSGLFSVQFCKDISGILLFHVRLKNSVHSGRIVWLELSLFNLSCWIFFCYGCRYAILYRQWIQCITFITICVPCGRCMLLVEYSVWQWSELLPNIILSQAQWKTIWNCLISGLQPEEITTGAISTVKFLPRYSAVFYFALAKKKLRN